MEEMWHIGYSYAEVISFWKDFVVKVLGHYKVEVKTLELESGWNNLAS